MIRNNKCILIIITLISNVLLPLFVMGQENYPIPPKTDKLLFYFQRSHNRNTVIYELNTLPSGQIDIDKPVNFYWIRYEENGVKKDLTFLQRKAFGLDWDLIDNVKKSFVLHFRCFRKRPIYLMKANGTGTYKTYITINGEFSELIRMYIKAENNSLGIPLSVKFIELSGISLKNNKSITERYIPK
jgi:hypothetical protein